MLRPHQPVKPITGSAQWVTLLLGHDRPAENVSHQPCSSAPGGMNGTSADGRS
jgi:hypothetical protein